MVTYTVKDGSVEENKRLVQEVYRALRDVAEPGVSYSTFVKEDGRTFVHIAFFESPEKQAILSNLPEFKAFQQDLGARCDIPPNAEPLTYVGSAGFAHPDEVLANQKPS